MGDLVKLIWYAVTGLLRPRAALQTETIAASYVVDISTISRLPYAEAAK